MVAALLVSILLILSFPTNVWAFNRDRCGKTFWKTRGEGLHTKAAYRLFNLSTSSGQFTSSTGNCAAVGKVSEERAQSLYAFNEDKILEDISKGNGEFFLALTHLWRCDNYEALHKVEEVRKIYSNLLSIESEDRYHFIKEKLNCSKASESQLGNVSQTSRSMTSL